VVAFERPDLAATRKELIIQTAANKAELKDIEDLLLTELAKEQTIPIVQNDELIAVLENAKAKATKIEGDMVTGK
jgi:dynein heavy chain